MCVRKSIHSDGQGVQINTGWFRLNSHETTKSRKSHAVFGRSVGSDFLHTCSTSPCQPVNERCLLFFFAGYLVVYFVLDNWALRHPNLSSEKNTSLRGRQGLTQYVCKDFSVCLPRTAWTFGLSCGKYVKFAWLPLIT